MLWVRGLVFTVLVPYMIAVAIPQWISDTYNGWSVGWVVIGVGITFYLASLFRFLKAGGTPTIYFTRPLRSVLGEEPGVVVESGLYRFTRNPMYVGVILTVLGQAVLYGSWAVGLYGLLLAPWFHFVVTRLEEPHLRKERGMAYEDYCRRVPRWFGRVPFGE